MSVPDVASAGALLVIDRSAARTSVFAVAALLAVLGSKVTELTVAVLVSVLPSGVLALTCATIVKLTVAPLAVGPVVQFTVPAEPTAGVVRGGAARGGGGLARVQVRPVLVPVQVQPARVAPWKAAPSGSESVTLIGAAAVLGPALLTASV